MSTSQFYRLLADVVLVFHFAVVLFVICGLMLVLIGNRLAWSWVNGLWFRLAHLACILVVVAESWFGFVCPLTTLEASLRKLAGSASYETSFVQHWVQRLLFYEAPSWVFTLAYTAFGILVVLTWWRFPPRLARERHKTRA